MVNLRKRASRDLWKGLLWVGFGLGVAGWGLMAVLIAWVYPVLWARWLFFAGLIMGVAGPALWGLLFLHALRYPEGLRVLPGTLVRQSLEIGALAAFLVWLQWGRLLTLPLAAIGYLVFLALEGTLSAWAAPAQEE